MTTGAIEFAMPGQEADATLVVAQQSTRLRGYRIGMHTDVAKALRTACTRTIEAFNAREPLTFAADVDYDAATQYLEVAGSKLTLPEPAKPSGSHQQTTGAKATVETDPEAHLVLRQAASLPLLKSGELGKRTFRFYALVVGDDPESRIAFVTQWNPHRTGLSGKILTAYGDQLRRISQPLLAFEPLFHMVVTPEGIGVLNMAAFEKVFRDVEMMQARIPIWAEHVESALPMADASLGCLLNVCSKNSRVARKARAIFESGILDDQTITVAMLATEMEQQGLEADRLVQGGKLVINEADVPDLLKLLDEGLWRGWLTGAAWEAGSKSQRS